MNTILQVCIGALPLLIAVAVYMIAKRKLNYPRTDNKPDKGDKEY